MAGFWKRVFGGGEAAVEPVEAASTSAEVINSLDVDAIQPVSEPEFAEPSRAEVASVEVAPAEVHVAEAAEVHEAEQIETPSAGEVSAPEPAAVGAPVETPEVQEVMGRMARLRGKLSSGLGKGILGAITGGAAIDWDDAEAVLLQADLGLESSQLILDGLRKATRSEGDVRLALRKLLLDQLHVDASRELEFTSTPGVIMVVGVNGTGKTTSCGKLAAMFTAANAKAILGAADTFRAAAAEQLVTWGTRANVAVVRGPEQGDPASVAFETVQRAISEHMDVAIIDTAGRLHNKIGLMDELGKVRRVIEKLMPVSEVLLVLDATTGQNGLVQAKVFAEAVNITGIVLTKLDGTAKGGIVFAVQRELGVPVKFVGLGEGMDDLAPFDPVVFVDSLLG